MVFLVDLGRLLLGRNLIGLYGIPDCIICDRDFFIKTVRVAEEFTFF